MKLNSCIHLAKETRIELINQIAKYECLRLFLSEKHRITQHLKFIRKMHRLVRWNYRETREKYQFKSTIPKLGRRIFSCWTESEPVAYSVSKPTANPNIANLQDTQTDLNPIKIPQRWSKTISKQLNVGEGRSKIKGKLECK